MVIVPIAVGYSSGITSPKFRTLSLSLKVEYNTWQTGAPCKPFLKGKAVNQTFMEHDKRAEKIEPSPVGIECCQVLQILSRPIFWVSLFFCDERIHNILSSILVVEEVQEEA